MPVTAKKNGSAERMKGLSDELATVLSSDTLPAADPIIIENTVGQTKSAHVVVIWDQWRRLPPPERSKAILDAYAAVKHKRLRGMTITVAMGLTCEEAIRTGFLPYSIVTTHSRGDQVTLAKLEKAMTGVGGIVVKVGSSTQLRFPNQQQAKSAYRRLLQKVPGPYWLLQEQLAYD